MAGLFYRDGRPAQTETVENMILSMPHRCGKGIQSISDGPVAFAFGFSSNSIEETFGGTLLKDDNLYLVGDIRLDNRTEITAALDPAECFGANVTDGQIVLAAYRRWGTSCVDHFYGDFTFAVWDIRTKTLFCARDHFGVKPLCLYSSDHIFAFASEPKALIALTEVPEDINEERICVHFFPELLLGDKTITMYRSVKRLEPAHRVLVSRESIHKEHYWKLDPYREAEYSSEKEYFDAFKDVFLRSVENRLRGKSKIGCTLSGGLDSSSIACASRDILEKQSRLPLFTYSAVFDSVPSADERHWIDAALHDRQGVVSRKVHPDQRSPLSDLDAMIWLHDGPFYGANYFIHLDIYRAARDDGVKIILDGEDGDTTVSHGIDFLLQLVQSGSWQIFAEECEAVVRAFDNSRTYASKTGMLKAHGIPYLEYLAKTGQWIKYFHALRHIHRLFGYSRKQLLIDHGLKALISYGKKSSVFDTGIMDVGLAAKYRVKDKLQEIDNRYRSSRFPAHLRQSHYDRLTSGALPYTLECLDRMASYYDIEVRHPFCDARLAEFCLSVPPHLKLRNGVSRYILRESLKGILPEEIRTRSGKGDLADVLRQGLKRFESSRILGLTEYLSNNAKHFMNQERLKETLGDFKNGGGQDKDTVITNIWQAAVLDRWMKNGNSKQPGGKGSQYSAVE
nr:lasso peptide isopeptide bond-forming cyclase [Marispirochaeta aestuarii]